MNSKLIFSLTFSLFASVSIANVGTDMDSFFNKAGYSSNTTLPNVWQNQAAGSFGGGSIYARNAVHTYQLIRLDLPEVRATNKTVSALAPSTTNTFFPFKTHLSPSRTAVASMAKGS